MAAIAERAHNIPQLRDLARRRLPRAIWEFVERGTEDDLLIGRNPDALRAVQLLPRTLRDVSARSAEITLFGRRQPLPLVIAPTGVADLMWHRGERAIAKAAATAGIPFTQTTSSTTSFAEIAKVASCGHWMQMYLWERRDLSWQVVDAARENGAEVLVLTVDTPLWPLREFNRRAGMSNPVRPNARLVGDFLRRPRWLASVMGRYMLEGGLPQFANYPAEVGGRITGKVSRVANSASVDWKDVAELRRRWPGKLVLKGLLHPDDARMAVDHGVDGIAVSNHGGRNFDSSPPAITALGDIVDAVAGRAAVLFDSGIRRGADVLKAMAIGADAVMVGRATLYGCAAAGEAGARHALALLANEIDVGMAMLGVNRLNQLDRSFLMPGTAGLLR
ncbi:alpha-hydroxy acid oxidase [Novosphingobium aerophilum]|uniref:alpha-hydroxy acid oxidase n=1 Tax=Novosphingobium TaxID=165696 RepID=UPI0006C8CDA4|nr:MULTISPECIES: alpha-hydroxy acid oxidase [unclassified Novosphingobium]KPH61264.1 2-hydroxyacid dehydrogenase [Novosphingobium sp. ST904]MPS68261.1 alpha-hydroxy-acid oxidizing protein [Novosphingobium sp.]TCM35415.1 L-lactate dehydrogenase (cytochrome)/(S)-mandelate dehydrogenase [Novosphingobium sp. ST904]